MKDDQQPISIDVTPENSELLLVFGSAKEQRVPLSLVEMLALAALELTREGQPTSIAAIMEHAEHQVWPNVEREQQYQGEGNTFDSYRSIARRNAEAVVWALQTDDPTTNLMYVAKSLPSA